MSTFFFLFCLLVLSVSAYPADSEEDLTRWRQGLAAMISHGGTPGDMIEHLLQNIQDAEYKALLTETLSNNPLLVAHTNWFQNQTGSLGRVYKIGVDAYTVPFTTTGLRYKAYSAVGYALANTILIESDEGFIVIDTGADIDTANGIIAALQAAGALPPGDGPLPIRALVYTHNHIDHTGGSERWIERAQLPPCPAANDAKDGIYRARSGCVEVFCQTGVPDAVVETSTRTGQPIDFRSAYMYGAFSVGGAINNGIGPQETYGNSTFHPPSKTFTDALLVKVAGLEMFLKHVPSETNDEIVAFFPDADNALDAKKKKRRRSRSLFAPKTARSVRAPKPCDDKTLEGITVPFEHPVVIQSLGPGLLASAEIIQGPSFPNLYSLRGTTFRNPLVWYQSVDILRLFNAWAMLPSHGVPLMGHQNIETLLVNFRDAIQIVHDQTLRLIRVGYVPDEIVDMIPEVPPYILNNLNGSAIASGLPNEPDMNVRDYLRTFYGSVPQSIRELYTGYLGWNEGDPTYFKPLPRVDRSNRYVSAMGGVDQVMVQALQAYEAGATNKQEYQWASELLAYVLRSSTATTEQKQAARLLKGKCFLQLASTTSVDEAVLEADWWSLNPNWRNWFVVGAEELGLSVLGLRFPNGKALNAPAIQSSVPPQYWVQQWSWRYNDSNNELQGKTFGWEFQPSPEFWGSETLRYVLQVAGSVVRFIADGPTVQSLWPSLDYAVSLGHPAYAKLVESDTSLVLSGPLPYNPRRFVETFEAMMISGEITKLKGLTVVEVARFYEPGRFDISPGFFPKIVER